MVATSNENAYPSTLGSPKGKKDTVSSQPARPDTSTSPKTETTVMPLIWESLESRGLSEPASKLILQSWRKSTRQQYKPFIAKWEQYCGSRKINPFSASIEQGINFLAELFQTGLGYSALNTARSALSTILVMRDQLTFGQHPLVCRFMKGIFESRPSLPRYHETWDVTIVLKHLAGLGPPESLSFKNLTLKVVMLMALLSGQRRQTLHSFNLDTMKLSSDKCVFVIQSLLKTSKPGKHLSFVEFQAYSPDVCLCVVKHLEQYIYQTQDKRSTEKQLLISFQKPHKAVSVDTISRWIKTVLQQAGIDTKVFGAHSTRSASTSAAKANSVSLETIMKSAGWSQESTFTKYYQMPIVSQHNFGQELLEKCSQ